MGLSIYKITLKSTISFFSASQMVRTQVLMPRPLPVPGEDAG